MASRRSPWSQAVLALSPFKKFVKRLTFFGFLLLGCGNFLLLLSCLAVSKMASSIRLHHRCLLSPSSALPSPQQTWSSLDPSESHPCWSNGQEIALSSEYRFTYSLFSCYTRNTVLRVPSYYKRLCHRGFPLQTGQGKGLSYPFKCGTRPELGWYS